MVLCIHVSYCLLSPDVRKIFLHIHTLFLNPQAGMGVFGCDVQAKPAIIISRFVVPFRIT